MRFRIPTSFILIALLAMGLITGCSDKKETATPLPVSPLDIQQDVPASPLVAPEDSTAPTSVPGSYQVTTPVPVTPAPGRGVVTGVLAQDMRGLPLQPVVNTKLFLARILTEENAPVELASLNENEAPASLTNDSGQFVFVGVEPGKYALVIKTPIQTTLAHDVAKDIDIVATVIADQVTELGGINVEMPY